MHSQATTKNARIARWNGPKLQGTIVALGHRSKQVIVTPGVYGGTGLASSWQKSATLRYKTASGRSATLTINGVIGMKLHQKLSFYIRHDGTITSVSGKERPRDMWTDLVLTCGMLGFCVGIAGGLIALFIFEAPWRPTPTIRTAA